MVRPLAVALLCVASSAQAYQLKRDSGGAVVRWSHRVEFVVDAGVGAAFGEPKALSALRAAVEAVDAAAQGLRVSLREGATDGVGYDSGGENQNEVLVPETWAFDQSSIAVTVLTVDARSHRILDADIAFNRVHRQFRVLERHQPGQGAYDDIQNVATHELGHAVGLAHNDQDPAVVMYPGARRGEINKRLLSADDRDGLLELYPASEAQALASEEPQVGCSAAAGSPSGWIVLGMGALWLWASARPRRRNRLAACALLIPAAALASPLNRPDAQATSASVVVTAEVLSTRPLRVPSQRKLLFTELELRVRECLKGSCPKTMVVVMPGGRDGDIEQTIDDVPVPGEGGVVGVTVDGTARAEAPELRRTAVYRLDVLRDFAAFASGLHTARIRAPLIVPRQDAPTR